VTETADPIVDPRNKRFGVETNGINFIGHEERLMTRRQLSLFWVASSLYPFNLLLGILVYSLGLPVWACLVVVVLVGGASYLYPALASMPGARSGIATQALTRLTYGIQGNRVNATLGWAVGIAYEIANVVTGVFAGTALLGKFGWHSGHGPTVVSFLLVYGVSVLLPYLGHATVVYVQQAFAVLLATGTLLMFVVLLPHLNLGAHQAGTGIGFWSALLTGCGIVLASGFGYVMMASDYPRYLPAATPARSIFWNVLISAGAPAAFLGLVGVLMAAQGNLTALIADPVGGADGLFAAGIFLIWLLAAIGGSIANNALTLYSAGLAAQAIGLPLKRYQATLLDAAIATVGIMYILFWDAGGFLGWLNSVLVFTIVWLGPFGAVWLVDLAWRGWLALPEEVHGGRRSPFWGFSGARRYAWVAMVAGMVAAVLCISVPKYTGPVARAAGDTDLSWLAGPIVAVVLYLALARTAVRREMQHRAENVPAQLTLR
jgi:nucleobase:cation symporter-1, NCS1 family